MQVTPEDATRYLKRAPNPNVTRVGNIWTLTASQMIYPVVISNQSKLIDSRFAGAYPELAKDGYNNLLVNKSNSYSLYYEG